MATASLSTNAGPASLTIERYFALVEEGVLEAEDRVELLNGVVVSMTPIDPPHAVVTELTAQALRAAISTRAAVRTQSPILLGRHSAPEPDVAVVAGSIRDYARGHPRQALLLVEVADSTLKQDRITKAAIYAAAGIPEYWIVNLRSDRVEVHRTPDRSAARYGTITAHGRGENLELLELPGAVVRVDDLLPEADAGR